MASSFFITPAKAQIQIVTATAISAGGYHSMALDVDGNVWAWGANSFGQLGDGTTTDSAIAVQVSGLTGVTAISTGYNHSLAVKGDGTVWGWGYNEWGPLANDSILYSDTPIQIANLTGVIAVTAGWGHSLAVKGDGTVWGWGDSTWGQIGDGTFYMRFSPVQTLVPTSVTAISSKWLHSMALDVDGNVWAWGDNTWGQIGDGTSGPYPIYTPFQVPGLTGVTAISAGYTHSLALKGDGTVWAWGWNIYGQLGDGTGLDHYTPVQVSDLTNVTAISAGYYFSTALKADGTIWAWGSNECGQLGDGTTTDRLAPIQVPDLSDITAISAGGFHTLALGTIWAWGANDVGQLGDGTTTEIPVTSPVQVYIFDLNVESGFKSGDSPSFASSPFLSDITCVLAKASNEYKLVGTSPGTFDYAISIENLGIDTFSSITIHVDGNEDFNLHGSNPIRILDANGVSITSQFAISVIWPTEITISSNQLFQGLLGSSSLYITVHLDYALKGEDGFPQLYREAYTLQTTVSGTSGSNSRSMVAYGSVAFLSKKATIIYGFVKTSSGMQIPGATIDLYQDGILLHTDLTDADGFYCFIDGGYDDLGNVVALSGGTTYTVTCTSPAGLISSQPVTAQAREAVSANFQV